MKNKSILKTLLFFFLIYIIVSNIIFVQAQSFNTPIWMEKGTFVQYEFKSAGIVFQNRTLVQFEPDAAVTWRWECTEINDDLATLNVSIAVTGEKKSLFISKEFNVNTTNRQVVWSNGTLIGTTNLWSKANPMDDEEIVVWDAPPDRIVGIAELRGYYSNTPQGAQKIYCLEGKGTINGKTVSFEFFNDIDTGIMIDGTIRLDATLLALDINSLGINGRLLFTDTNIDLGPRELLPEILGLLPIIIVAIIFISVLVILYYRRKKRRKYR